MEGNLVDQFMPPADYDGPLPASAEGKVDAGENAEVAASSLAPFVDSEHGGGGGGGEFLRNAVVDASQSPTSRLLRLETEVLELKRTIIGRDAALRDARWAQEKAESGQQKLQIELKKCREREKTLAESLEEKLRRISSLEEERTSATLGQEELELSSQAQRQRFESQEQMFTAEIKSLRETLADRELAAKNEVLAFAAQAAMTEKKFLSLQLAHEQIKRAWEEANETIADLQSRIEQLATALNAKDQIIQEKDKTLQTLRADNSRLQERLRLAAEDNTIPPPSSRTQLLSQALKELDQQRQETSFWKQKYQTVQHKETTLQRQSLTAQEYDSQLMTEVDHSRSRIVALEKALASVTQSMDREEAKNEDLQRKLCDASLELSRFTRYKQALEDKLVAALSERDNSHVLNVRDVVQQNLELQEAIRSNEEKMRETLRNQALQMTANLQEMERRVADHNQKKTAIMEEMTQRQQNLKLRMETYAAKIVQLEAELTRRNEVDVKVAQDRENWQNEQRRLHSRLEAASEKISAMQNAQQALQTEKLDLAMMLATKNSEVAFARSQLEREMERCVRLNGELDGLRSGEMKVRGELMETKRSLQEVKSLKEVAEGEVSSLRCKLSELNWSKSLVEEEMRLLSEEMSMSVKQHGESRAYMEDQVAKLECWLGQLQTENNSLRETVKEKDSALEGLQSALSKLESENQESSAVRKSQLLTIEQLNQELAQAKTQIDVINAQSHEKEKHLQTLRKDFHQLYEISSISSPTNKTPITHILNQTPPQRSEDDRTSPPTDLVSALEEKSSRIEKLEGAIEELEMEINQTLKPEIDKLQSSLSSTDTKMKLLQTTIDDQSATISKLENEKKDLLEKVSSLRSECDKCEENGRALQCEKKKLELKVEEIVKELEHVKEDLEASRQSYRAVVQAHAADMSEAEEYKKEKDNLLEKLSDIRRALEKSQDDISRERSDFEKYMAKAKSDYETLQTTYQELQKDFNTLVPKHNPSQGTTPIPATTDDKDGVKLQYVQAIRQRDNLMNELHSVKIESAQLKAKNSTVEKTLENVRSQLNDSNSKIGELRRKIQAQSLLYSPDILLERTTLQRQIEEIELEKSQLSNECKRLEKDLAGERASQLPMRTQLSEYESKNNLLRLEVQRLTVADQTWQKEYSQLVATYKGREIVQTPTGKVKIPDIIVQNINILVRTCVKHTVLLSILIKLKPSALRSDNVITRKRTRGNGGSDDNDKSIIKRQNTDTTSDDAAAEQSIIT